MEFPILHDPGSIKLLMRTVSKTDPPEKVDHDYLVNLGFKREVDEGLLKLLSHLGFTDETGRPTTLWQKYNDTDSDAVLLEKAVRKAYDVLFAKYPEAYDVQGITLMEFFKETTGTSDNNAAYMILTFKVLCDLAHMSSETAGTSSGKEETVHRKEKTDNETGENKRPVLRVTVDIDIDPDREPELYSLLVELLTKYLER